MHPKTRKILQLLRLRQVKIDTFFCVFFLVFLLFSLIIITGQKNSFC